MSTAEDLLKKPPNADTAETLRELIRTDTLSKPQRQLLAIHRKSNNFLSIKEIQAMAIQDVYPKNIGTCPRPVCAQCLYGKAHKRPWRTKGKKISTIRRERLATDPPNGITCSTDTFVSSVPGLIPQSTGIMMNTKYTAGTVFAEHDSNMCHVHLQIDQTTESAIEAKESFEREISRYNKQVVRYHADNGIFTAEGFKEHVAANEQEISYCGVGAHFQNGIAENLIKCLSGPARTMLLNAIQLWPEVVQPCLWPYAIKIAEWNRNNLHRNKKTGLTPLE